MVVATKVAWVLLAVLTMVIVYSSLIWSFVLEYIAENLSQSLSLCRPALSYLVVLRSLQQFLFVLLYQPLFFCSLLFTSSLHGVCQLYSL